MRTKFVSAVMIVTILLNVGLFIQSSKAQTCIGGGALQITSVPATESLGSINASSSAQNADHTFGTSIYFEDMRGTVPGGFTLSITATDLEANGGADKIDVTNVSIESDNNDALGLVDCDNATGITVSQATLSAFTDGNDDGTSDSKNLFVGDNRARVGKYSFEPNIRVSVPAYQPPGTYNSTLTFNII